MLELRKKLANYQEIFYMLFLLPMTGMTSMGLNSEDRIYLYVFAVATLFLLLKMAVTDFTWQEIAIMAVLTLLFGVNFLRNGEKTLILTVMAIFGAKNVNLDKVMKYALWEKAVLTVWTLTLVATGVIENELVILPKNGDLLEIYCYGYYSANMAFANIFVILLLTVIVYQERLKWYIYVIETMILIVAYKFMICRTGLVVWFVLCFMIIGYWVMKHFSWEKMYLRLITFIPIVLMSITLIIPPLAQRNSDFSAWINKILTGRVRFINEVYSEVWTLLLGHIPGRPFDSMYFHTLFNYGWILLVLCLVAYVAGMWYCNFKGQYYVTIALGTMAIYGYMELLPLSVLWNLPLIYFAQLLFKGRKALHE